jgi:hypothetical protein
VICFSAMSVTQCHAVVTDRISEIFVAYTFGGVTAVVPCNSLGRKSRSQTE